MRIDILKDIERTIENVIEDEGIKSVEIGDYVIKVEMDNSRAFARLFPNENERIARKDNYNYYVEAFDGEYVFYIKFDYESGYNEFKEHYPVTESWCEKNA